MLRASPWLITLLFILSSLVTITLQQQCSQNQTYVVVPAHNLKDNANNTLRLGVTGLFYGDSTSFAGSVLRFAAERINNNTDVLPNTRVELVFLPSPASDLSSNLLITLFAIQNLYVKGIIGGISTSESRVIQLAAKLYGIPEISAHAVGTLLANREEYPYYACTQPFDYIQINAIIAQFTYFNWTKGIIIYNDNDYGLGYSLLVTQAAKAGVDFLAYSVGSGTSIAGITSQMEEVAKQAINNKYRIFVLYTTAQTTAYVMSLADQLGIVGNLYVYVLPTNAAGVYTQNLTPDVKPLLKGSISVILPSPSGTFYNQEYAAYAAIRTTTNQYLAPTPNFQFFWTLYDPLYAFIYAFDTLLKQGHNFNDIKGDLLYNQILDTTFNSTSGEMKFTSAGDREGYYSVTSFQSNVSVEVARYYVATSAITLLSRDRNFVFFDGTNTVPDDGTYVETPEGYICRDVNGQRICERDYTLHKYSPGLAGGLGAIVAVGVLVAFFAVAMLLYNWKIFIGKYGSFYCAVVLSGVFTSYVAAFSLLPEPTDALCLVFPWFLGIAFTLVYGCLFIKAWILYRLWRYALQLKRMAITALTVVKYVGVALVAEIYALLIVWTAVDPPKVHLIKMVDHTLQPQCRSDTAIFWIIFLSMKGVWLSFGCVVSVLTRTVVKEYHNFTEFVYAMEFTLFTRFQIVFIFNYFDREQMYNILIMVIIAVPLGVLLREVPNGVTIVSVIVIVLAFMFSTVVLFFNIWYSILFTGDQMPSIGSMTKSSPSQSKITNSNSSSSRT